MFVAVDGTAVAVMVAEVVVLDIAVAAVDIAVG